MDQFLLQMHMGRGGGILSGMQKACISAMAEGKLYLASMECRRIHRGKKASNHLEIIAW